MKVLMVCLGNICRSPLAEGILQEKVKQNGLYDWQIDSAGTSGWHEGQLPDGRSISTALDHSLDISNQRSRKLLKKDIKEYDLILAMDSQNYRDIISLCENEEEKAKVKMIMNYLYPGKNVSVPDPYWGEHGFENVYEMLDQACDALIENECC